MNLPPYPPGEERPHNPVQLFIDQHRRIYNQGEVPRIELKNWDIMKPEEEDRTPWNSPSKRIVPPLPSTDPSSFTVSTPSAANSNPQFKNAWNASQAATENMAAEIDSEWRDLVNWMLKTKVEKGHMSVELAEVISKDIPSRDDYIAHLSAITSMNSTNTVCTCTPANHLTGTATRPIKTPRSRKKIGVTPRGPPLSCKSTKLAPNDVVNSNLHEPQTLDVEVDLTFLEDLCEPFSRSEKVRSLPKVDKAEKHGSAPAPLKKPLTMLSLLGKLDLSDGLAPLWLDKLEDMVSLKIAITNLQRDSYDLRVANKQAEAGKLDIPLLVTNAKLSAMQFDPDYIPFSGIYSAELYLGMSHVATELIEPIVKDSETNYGEELTPLSEADNLAIKRSDHHEEALSRHASQLGLGTQIVDEDFARITKTFENMKRQLRLAIAAKDAVSDHDDQGTVHPHRDTENPSIDLTSEGKIASLITAGEKMAAEIRLKAREIRTLIQSSVLDLKHNEDVSLNNGICASKKTSLVSQKVSTTAPATLFKPSMAQALRYLVVPEFTEFGWSLKLDEEIKLADDIIQMLANGENEQQIAVKLSRDIIKSGSNSRQAELFSKWLFEQIQVLHEELGGKNAALGGETPQDDSSSGEGTPSVWIRVDVQDEPPPKYAETMDDNGGELSGDSEEPSPKYAETMDDNGGELSGDSEEPSPKYAETMDDNGGELSDDSGKEKINTGYCPSPVPTSTYAKKYSSVHPVAAYTQLYSSMHHGKPYDNRYEHQSILDAPALNSNGTKLSKKEHRTVLRELQLGTFDIDPQNSGEQTDTAAEMTPKATIAPLCSCTAEQTKELLRVVAAEHQYLRSSGKCQSSQQLADDILHACSNSNIVEAPFWSPEQEKMLVQMVKRERARAEADLARHEEMIKELARQEEMRNELARKLAPSKAD